MNFVHVGSCRPIRPIRPIGPIGPIHPCSNRYLVEVELPHDVLGGDIEGTHVGVARDELDTGRQRVRVTGIRHQANARPRSPSRGLPYDGRPIRCRMHIISHDSGHHEELLAAAAAAAPGRGRCS